MSDNGNIKRTIRTIGINFPFSDEGNFIYKCLKVTKDQEDRSMSNVIFRILKSYFNESNNEFKEFVRDEMEIDLKVIAMQADTKEEDPDHPLD